MIGEEVKNYYKHEGYVLQLGQFYDIFSGRFYVISDVIFKRAGPKTLTQSAQC